jgi:hypothetical protein
MAPSVHHPESSTPTTGVAAVGVCICAIQPGRTVCLSGVRLGEASITIPSH